MAELAVAAFAAGVLGGVHCAGMCGGIVAALSSQARGPAFSRQLAFNAGRIGSYAIAGALAGLLGGLAQVGGALFAAQAILFVTANLVMILLGLYIAGWGNGVLRLERAGGALWRRIEPLRRRFFPVDSTFKAVGAGAVWGWIPCGLVYSMLTLALASGGVASGAGVMAAFGLGTLPTLLTAGVASQRVLQLRQRGWVRRTAGALIVLLAVASLIRAPFLHDALHSAWLCVS